MRKSGIVEKYVLLVEDMYEGSETVVRCAVGTTESFKVKVGLHHGSVLSPFLFAVIMDRLTNEVKRKSPWIMLFADIEDVGDRKMWRMMIRCGHP